jgi:hypothetical protein
MRIAFKANSTKILGRTESGIHFKRANTGEMHTLKTKETRLAQHFNSVIRR